MRGDSFSNTDKRIERMRYLVRILNEASENYYNKTPTMSDREYDILEKELTDLENETGIILYSSPSTLVGRWPVSGDKMPHIRPILSLKSTKNVDELLYFLKENEGILSWKLDGISIVLYYMDGTLVNALTRGNGTIGKVIFGKAMGIPNIPKKISVKGDFVVRGEGCLALREFDQIKKTKLGEQFSNPRNVVAGIINSDDPPDILLRHVTFVAHSIVFGTDEFTKRSDQLRYLEELGFHVVPHSKVFNFRLKYVIEYYTEHVDGFEYPVDGLVLSINDITTGESLGETAKYPKHSLAFKWPDEKKLAVVNGVKWSVSKTGLITPVVTFEPIELEGTIVKQANLHTLKRFEDLAIGKGDILEVYKANKIIPEIGENLTRSGTIFYPRHCPLCDAETYVMDNNKTRKLYCGNQFCRSRSQNLHSI